MDIEQIFAAEIFSARRTAAEFTESGIRQTISEIVGMALDDVWAFYTAGHFSREHIVAIVDKYVRYDKDDQPWPRDDIDWGNVVALR